MMERFAGLGAVGTALLAGICCVGLTVLSALGLSGVGVILAAVFAPYRLWFALATIMLLLVSHGLAWWKWRRGRISVYPPLLLVSTALALFLLLYTYRASGF